MKRTQLKASAPFLRRITLLPEKVDPSRHPFDVAALRELDLELRSKVTFFVGENGSGKSTLLEAVAQCCGFNVQGGGRDHRAQTVDNRGDLASALRLSWVPKVTEGFFMRAESFFNFASYIDHVSNLKRYGGRRLHEQSHGESFLALFANRFDRGIYVLDEPEAALSPRRQLELLQRIHRLILDGSQFVIATHSPMLMAYPGALIYTLSKQGITRTSYRETDHYRLTRQFLEEPEATLDEALSDEPHA